MKIIPLLGIIGTVIGLVRALPQLLKLLRARKAHGVSVDTAATSAAVSFGWTAYGMMTGQPYVALATGASGVVFSAIVFFALRFGRRAGEMKVAPFWLLVLLPAGVVFGGSGLAVVLPISVMVANAPQLRLVFRENNLAELSLGTWLLSMADGGVWGAYALLQGDVSIMVFAFFQLSTSSLITASKLLYTVRRSKEKVVL